MSFNLRYKVAGVLCMLMLPYSLFAHGAEGLGLIFTYLFFSLVATIFVAVWIIRKTNSRFPQLSKFIKVIYSVLILALCLIAGKIVSFFIGNLLFDNW